MQKGWTRAVALARLMLTKLWNPLDYIENPSIWMKNIVSKPLTSLDGFAWINFSITSGWKVLGKME